MGPLPEWQVSAKMVELLAMELKVDVGKLREYFMQHLEGADLPTNPSRPAGKAVGEAPPCRVWTCVLPASRPR